MGIYKKVNKVAKWKKRIAAMQKTNPELAKKLEGKFQGMVNGKK